MGASSLVMGLWVRAQRRRARQNLEISRSLRERVPWHPRS
jgi:hypothetical protein